MDILESHQYCTIGNLVLCSLSSCDKRRLCILCEEILNSISNVQCAMCGKSVFVSGGLDKENEKDDQLENWIISTCSFFYFQSRFF